MSGESTGFSGKRQFKLGGVLESASIYLILLGLFLYGSFFVPHFLSGTNLTAVFYQYSIIGILAVGQLIIMLTGGIDLSQGAAITLVSVITALVIRRFGFLAAIVAGIMAGTGIGLINGLLVSRTRMPAFLVTLGMTGIIRSIALQITNSKPIPIYDDLFKWLGRFDFLHVPFSAFVWLAVCVAVHYVLRRRRIGIYIYALGSNEENTRLSGIGVSNLKLAAYVIASFFTSIAGIVWASHLGTGTPIGGVNYELETIAGVVIGGGSLSGGVGTIPGVAAGVMIFGAITSLLNLSWVSPFWQGMLKGAILLAAISLRSLKRHGNAGR